jgi:hypothetical protein
MTQRAYARSRGLDPSVVSRQVAAGIIPTRAVAGRRLIDPRAADAARLAELDPRRGGGRGGHHRHRRERPDGFEPAQARLLDALFATGPDLLRRLMLRAGGTEAEAARAVAAYEGLVGYLAAALYDRVTGDYTRALEPWGEPAWTEAAREVRRRCAEAYEGMGERWGEEADATLIRDLLAAGARARSVVRHRFGRSSGSGQTVSEISQG